MLQKLTPANLDSWIRELLKAGFSKNTILRVKAFVRQALNYATLSCRTPFIQSGGLYQSAKKSLTNQIMYLYNKGYFFTTPKTGSVTILTLRYLRRNFYEI